MDHPGGGAADCAAITRLNREELGYDFPEEGTREKLRACLANPVHKIFVAESGGEVVGYLHLEDYDVLYLPPHEERAGHRGGQRLPAAGVGRALLAAGEAWAKADGAVAVRLVSGEGREGAHAFYQSLGYTGNKLQRNFKKLL